MFFSLLFFFLGWSKMRIVAPIQFSFFVLFFWRLKKNCEGGPNFFLGWGGGVQWKSFQKILAIFFTWYNCPITQHCTALHCTALHCTLLHFTELHCPAQHYTALHHFTKILKTALHYTKVHCPACNTTKFYIHFAVMLTSKHCPEIYFLITKLCVSPFLDGWCATIRRTGYCILKLVQALQLVH